MSIRLSAGAGWRCAAAAVLLAAAVGCSSRPTEPVKDASMRGTNEPPLTGVPTVKPFVEADVAPPGYPAEANLIEFWLRGQTTNRFFIDGSTLDIGPDRVIRFVLVIRTIEDVRNVRFAGLRCGDRQWKDYAFARSDRTWTRAENAQWRSIENLIVNDYQATLYKDYFCAGGVFSSEPVGDRKKLVKLLKNPPKQDPRVYRKE
jgi:CNP1-like family